MTKTFSTEDAETITYDLAVMIQEAGVTLTAEQVTAIGARMLPYIHEITQSAAHKAWAEGHLEGALDSGSIRRTTPNPYPFD